MTDAPREATESHTLEGLRERWPGYDVHAEWWGILVLPAGTPYITALFAESAEDQLERLSSSRVDTQVSDLGKHDRLTSVNTSDVDETVDMTF